MEDDGSTPAQAVFGSPLILPGQFLDSPELPSKIFLEQFSKTLSAAEHTSTRHNTAAAHRLPPQLLDDLARVPTVFVRWDVHVLPLQPLYDGPYAVIRRFLHHFTLGIGDKEDKVSTFRLHRPYNATCAAQGPGRPARRRRFPGFSPARGRGGPPGTFCHTAASRTAQGTVFPWPAARDFCTPCRHSARPQPPSAVHIRPLGLRPRGLGGALWRLISATSQAKLVSPPCPIDY
jgi:hypothetical protein